MSGSSYTTIPYTLPTTSVYTSPIQPIQSTTTTFNASGYPTTTTSYSSGSGPYSYGTYTVPPYAMSGLSGMTLPYTPTSYPSYYGQTYSSLYARATSPAEPPPPPDYSSINPEVATKAIERLVLVGLKNVGFDGSEPGAMKRLEAEVVECTFLYILMLRSWTTFLIPRLDVKMLFERTHEIANLANRSGPIVTDLLLACKERNVDPEQLKRVAGGPRGNKRKLLGACSPSVLLSVYSSPSP